MGGNAVVTVRSQVGTTGATCKRGKDVAPQRKTRVPICLAPIPWGWQALPSTTNCFSCVCHTKEHHGGLRTSWSVFCRQMNSSEAACPSHDPVAPFSHLFPVVLKVPQNIRFALKNRLCLLSVHNVVLLLNRLWHLLISISTELGLTSAPPFYTVKVASLGGREGRGCLFKYSIFTAQLLGPLGHFNCFLLWHQSNGWMN